jgi:hypothetical protein
VPPCPSAIKDKPRTGRWTIAVIDTSNLAPEQVADEVLGWCRRVLVGQTAVLRVLSNPNA